MMTVDELMKSLLSILDLDVRKNEPIVPPGVRDKVVLGLKVTGVGLAAYGLFAASRAWARGTQTRQRKQVIAAPLKKNERNPPETTSDGAVAGDTGEQQEVPARG